MGTSRSYVGFEVCYFTVETLDTDACNLGRNSNLDDAQVMEY